MNICEIGSTFRTTQQTNYVSNQNFVDFDLVIINLSTLFASLHNKTEPIAKKRELALAEFLTHKNVPLICYNPEPFAISLGTTIVRGNKLDHFLPISQTSVISETGTKLEIVQGTHFTDFLKKYEKCFTYTSYFDDYTGNVLLQTPLTKKVLSFYNKQIVFLPRFTNSISNVEKEFLEDLSAVVTSINKNVAKVKLPEWTTKYYLPTEKKIVDEINSLEIEIRNKIQLQTEKQKALDEVKLNKALFSGTGDNLENQVGILFKGLGFKIHETEEFRDDMIVEYKEKVAVIEIKGVVGSAAEKHAAQLEKWVSMYYEEHEVEAKGILIVNSFKDKELVDRPDAFPPQMIPYCTKRGHCLLTTLQLLGLFYHIQSHPEQCEELIDDLYNTTGVYKKFGKWEEFISVEEVKS